MDKIRNYKRCHVIGEGRILKKSKRESYQLYVIDISATGVRIRTKVDLQLKEDVEIDVTFSSHIMEIPLKVAAEVAKKIKIGNEYEYALKYVNLSLEQTVEIDEILTRTCGHDKDILHMHH